MPSSRRRLLAYGGAVVASLSAGCASLDSERCDESPDVESPIEIRLVGPETNRLLFARTHVATVGPLREHGEGFAVPVVLTERAATRVVDRFGSVGVNERPARFQIAIVAGDRELARFGVDRALVATISSGEWDGEFRLRFRNRKAAADVREAIRCP